MTQPEGPLPKRAEKWVEGLGIGIVGLLIILFVCAILTIAALVLLGPVIGNVFSGIVTGGPF